MCDVSDISDREIVAAYTCKNVFSAGTVAKVQHINTAIKVNAFQTAMIEC